MQFCALQTEVHTKTFFCGNHLQSSETGEQRPISIPPVYTVRLPGLVTLSITNA
jgi:hypothetical protein